MDQARHGAARAVAVRGDVLDVPTAAVRGVEGAALRAAARDGALVRLRYGAYVDPARWDALPDGARYRLRVRAAARRLDDAVFSHDSAAALHGLPRIGAWPADVHVVVARTGGGRSSPGVRRHAVRAMPPGCVVDGVRCTSVARTVVDVARTWGLAGGLVAADHALAAGTTDLPGLAAELRAAGDGRGTRGARRVVAAASPLSESVGESLSRARMLELGFRLPVLQHEVRDGGELVARVDFWWPDVRLVGEFDGRLKYRAGGVPDPRAAEDRVWAEKRREDRLRALGLRVIRWTWDDALRSTPLATLLTRAGAPAA